MPGIFDSITQRLKPSSICLLCNQFHRTKLPACDLCLSRITTLDAACMLCANQLPPESSGLCGLCITSKPDFDAAWIPCKFEEPMRSLLHQFKYHQGLYLGKLLAHFMLKAFPDNIPLPDYLMPVPIHSARMRTRGFNQTAVLARILAKALRIPCELDCAVKTVDTPPQVSLSGEERRKNLCSAFQVFPKPALHVVLVDDLMTTGSTVNALARLLKREGIAKVTVWCCART